LLAGGNIDKLLRADFTPTAADLAAGCGLASLKTLLITLSLLDGPHQFGLLQLAHLDVVQLRNRFDLFQFHDSNPP
jgi:hypothetical protein